MFSLGSLLLAIFLAAAAYSFTRSSLLTQRDRTAIGEVKNHANSAGSLLSGDSSAAAALGFLANQGVTEVGDLLRGPDRESRDVPGERDPARTAPSGRRRRDTGTTGGRGRRRPGDRRGLPAQRWRLLRGGRHRRDRGDARLGGAVAVLRRTHHVDVRRGARLVRSQPCRAPPRRRSSGGATHRRWPSRHPARTDRRPRSAHPGPVVQRHGVGAAGTRGARCPVRERREPRAAVTADDVGGERRGDAGPTGRHARTRPDRSRSARQRRRQVPGPRRGPARDQPVRTRERSDSIAKTCWSPSSSVPRCRSAASRRHR